MKKVIRLNDITSHGGKVITATSSFNIDGVPVALINDLVSCPEHGINPIVECSRSFVENGKGIVVEQCKSACGSIVFSSQKNVIFE
ncbi:PAAR domain-containing protein [Limnobaculum parvum]|uniref:PAAR domain-containing protein n=1 Tax=Limnobaculum parvum TaxID=2172103 RepID=A0A2Y9TW93_9GAMM|nr:PAAR domain-containing protein [Limnobaculum parvum]AWH87886.1 PAAR domain-containing protein [Limnobaculum parvum]